jgi:RNA polymerase sigma factor (TIGR02999 family)
MMRQLLVARARNRNALKRGGGQPAGQLDEEQTPIGDWLKPEELIELNRALEELESLDAQKARIVEYRFFAGLSIEETAEAMSLSPATVKRHWEFARRWLHHKVSGEADRT